MTEIEKLVTKIIELNKEDYQDIGYSEFIGTKNISYEELLNQKLFSALPDVNLPLTISSNGSDIDYYIKVIYPEGAEWNTLDKFAKERIYPIVDELEKMNFKTKIRSSQTTDKYTSPTLRIVAHLKQ